MQLGSTEISISPKSIAAIWQTGIKRNRETQPGKISIVYQLQLYRQ